MAKPFFSEDELLQLELLGASNIRNVAYITFKVGFCVSLGKYDNIEDGVWYLVCLGRPTAKETNVYMPKHYEFFSDAIFEVQRIIERNLQELSSL